jgi:hypothetical protein
LDSACSVRDTSSPPIVVAMQGDCHVVSMEGVPTFFARHSPTSHGRLDFLFYDDANCTTRREEAFVGGRVGECTLATGTFARHFTLRPLPCGLHTSPDAGPLMPGTRTDP